MSPRFFSSLPLSSSMIEVKSSKNFKPKKSKNCQELLLNSRMQRKSLFSPGTSLSFQNKQTLCTRLSRNLSKKIFLSGVCFSLCLKCENWVNSNTLKDTGKLKIPEPNFYIRKGFMQKFSVTTSIGVFLAEVVSQCSVKFAVVNVFKCQVSRNMNGILLFLTVYLWRCFRSECSWIYVTCKWNFYPKMKK